MRQSITAAWLICVLESLLPRDIGEIVAGDLTEEFQLRNQASSRARAILWLSWQVVTSAPGLLQLSVLRWSLFRSLTVALLAFGALIFVESCVRRVLEAVFEIRFPLNLCVDLLVGFAVCLGAGFCATWMHRGSAMPLALIGTITLGAMAFVQGAQAPHWYLTIFILIALFAPIAGGAVFIAKAKRSGN